MKPEQIKRISNLGQLKQSGYEPRSIKLELRENLIENLKKGINVFEGIWGYEDTVIPDLERAILSTHDINFLGLRGQAKTRMARMMIRLLDEYVPIIKGSELNDDPMRPISRYGIDAVKQHGDDTPVDWLRREDRYSEKLATPDVSVADLIGDADPIKAATLKLPYSDERVIHFGLIPRSHRCLFVINELPDLQARIQVALFNILQEGDIQIRGFKVRMPLDIQFVFTANPEDYTNRGSIVTPLKDRIGSQIITHYPKSIETGRKITDQEARMKPGQAEQVTVNEIAKDLIEQIAFEARESEYVDAKSGVSARLTISALENLTSAVERRALINHKQAYVRVSDLYGVAPSITGKVELVYEGEQEGSGIVALNLVSKAIRTRFTQLFPDPDKIRKQKNKVHNPYKTITQWFGNDQVVDILYNYSDEAYRDTLNSIPGLSQLIDAYHRDADEPLKFFLMEFALHGLSEFSMLSRHNLTKGIQFKDLLSSMFTLPNPDDPDEDDDLQ